MTTNSAKKPTKSKQEQSEARKPVEKLAATLRTDVGFEYHLELPRSVIEDLIDPETPDVRIEVPCSLHGTRRFLHTSYIKELDVRGL